jgi:dipeptidyl aminopeptidase/acylaminoacyl peptidase
MEEVMKRVSSLFANLRPAVLLAASLMCSSLLTAQGAPAAQPTLLKPGDNLVVENIPPVPAAIAEKANQYGEFRAAGLQDWHPTKREMLIGTRFADVPQIHMVKMPGGDRTQLTFFPDRTGGGHYGPNGDYFTFSKDIGGGEWFQIYRYDIASGSVTLLTDGKSRNTGRTFAHDDNRIAYTSTRRTGQDNDSYVMDPTKMLTPKSGDVQIAYSGGPFSKDGKGFYTTTDRDSEFQRLAYFDLATMKPTYLTSDIKWDVDEVDLSDDGKTLAFVTNEDGISTLYLMNTATGKYRPVANVPTGLIGGLSFHKNSRDLGFVLTSARSTSDVYSVDVVTNKLERWTSSETGGLNTATFAEPQLIKWPTFDGKTISGFLYMPDATKFPGKRPVMVNIHGGPEGQYRPGFLGRNNFYLNEMGVALIFPNVRGSTGYGKTFLKLDNGVNRDHTHKDIGALLDWIGKSPTLDSSRIMITGGSYGGYMTWAIAYEYNDKICCSLPIVGPSNLVTLLEHTEAYRRDLRRVEYGDERDPKIREYLEKTAPLNNSEKIRKPVFAAVGKNDPRVPWTESRQMLDKLKSNGIQTWFLMANDEGHGYAKKKNQDFLFYSTILFVQQFLLGEQKGAAGTQ